MAERRNNYEKYAIIVATENISSYTAYVITELHQHYNVRQTI